MTNTAQAKIDSLHALEEDLAFIGFMYQQAITDEDRFRIADELDQVTGKILDIEYKQLEEGRG